MRSKEDVSHYFVVDSWGKEPVIRLVRRNSEEAGDLLTLALPPDLEKAFKEEYGNLKGVFAPTPASKDWLRHEMYA